MIKQIIMNAEKNDEAIAYVLSTLKFHVDFMYQTAEMMRLRRYLINMGLTDI